MSQTVWPLNENGEIVFTAGTGSGNVTGYLNQDVLPSADGGIPAVFPSEAVAFKQSGTGAVSRNVQDRLREYVSVMDFMTEPQKTDVKSYGGTIDVTQAFQNAINQASVKACSIFVPKGKYKITSSLIILNRATRIVGDGQGRGDSTNKGTELSFVGSSGDLFSIGTDDGNPWDSNNYDGVQGFFLEDITIVNRSSSRTTVLNCNASAYYAPNSYAIRDWRGGHIQLRNVGIEGFEYNFWGIQSDFNRFENVMSLYSKHGIYAGPRSDQFSIYDLYSFFCDRAITVDGATCVNLFAPVFVQCGSLTDDAVTVKAGSNTINMVQPWFENYNSVEIMSFVGAGRELGYNGNSVNVRDLNIAHPMIASNASGSANGYARYLVSVGRADAVTVDNISAANGISVTTNLKAIFGFVSGIDHTVVGSRVFFYTQGNFIGSTKLSENLGTGSPSIFVYQENAGATSFANTTGRLEVRRIGGNVGADNLRLSTDNVAGQFVVSTPTYATGQVNRLILKKVIQHGTAAPSSGTWEQGDRVLNSSPIVGQPKSWVCTVSGTPGTWVSEGNL